jgi:hypothetical protein
MNTIINLAIRLSGLGYAWDKIDGYKSKVGAAGLMLAGGGMMLGSAAQVLSAYVACIDHTCQIALFRGLTSSDSSKLLLEGFITFKAGLMGLGLAHKLEKAVPATPQNLTVK